MTHDIQTDVPYYEPPTDGTPIPYNDWSIMMGDIGLVKHQYVVQDVRGKEDSFSLDRNGFMVINHQSKVQNLHDRDVVRGAYFDELSEFLKQTLGARKVFLFGDIRRSLPRGWWPPEGQAGGHMEQGPAGKAHIDVTSRGAETWLHQFLPEEVDNVLASARWMMLSAWRPTCTVHRDPLAVADASSIPKEDLLKVVPSIKDGRELEAFILTHGEGSQHRWHYIHQQKPDELFLIKLFDSANGPGIISGTPHCSVTAPGTEEDPPRESLDVRAVVCW